MQESSNKEGPRVTELRFAIEKTGAKNYYGQNITGNSIGGSNNDNKASLLPTAAHTTTTAATATSIHCVSDYGLLLLLEEKHEKGRALTHTHRVVQLVVAVAAGHGMLLMPLLLLLLCVPHCADCRRLTLFRNTEHWTFFVLHSPFRTAFPS